MPGALDLLETLGGPFEGRAYRDALTTAVPKWRDVSFGASLPDGRQAAIALVASGRHAESLPPEAYGGVVATGPLHLAEVVSFLRRARLAAGATSLDVRGVLIGKQDQRAGAKVISTASVVHIFPGERPEAKFSRLTRRSIKRATEAGGAVVRSSGAEAFLALYEQASAKWTTRYPHDLIRLLGRKELAVFHDVTLGGSVAASLMTLTCGSHWMCWLAAQSDAGRAVSASYLAYEAVFTDAAAQHVPTVNLGASAPGSGGGDFKKRLGAVEVPIVAWRERGRLAALRDTIAAKRSAAAARLRGSRRS